MEKKDKGTEELCVCGHPRSKHKNGCRGGKIATCFSREDAQAGVNGYCYSYECKCSQFKEA